MRHCKKAPEIDRHLFQIIAFDWDGTAVTDRTSDALPVAKALEALLRLDVIVVVITGTNFRNIDRQFGSLIKGPHKINLYICVNGGSEVYGFDAHSKPKLLYRREAAEEENRLLDKIAEAVKAEIESRSGVEIDIIYDHLNRRKIDLIPEWHDPPKSRIGELIARTGQRLSEGGFGEGIKGAYELTIRYARDTGLSDARITSDVKHIEVGLTDKSDSVRWILQNLASPRHIRLRDILIAGDEFGPVAGFPGSDYHMVIHGGEAITRVSVGKEPNGVPESVLHLGGGPRCFLELVNNQFELRHKLRISEDEAFLLVEDGFNPMREREIESIFAVSNGYLGTRGSLEEQNRASDPATLVAGIYDNGTDGIEELAAAPDWLFTRLHIFGMPFKLSKRSTVEHRRILDLRKGVYHRYWRHKDPHGRMTSIRFMRFVSMDDPHILVLRVKIIPENYNGPVQLETGIKLTQGEGARLNLLDQKRQENGVMTLVTGTSEGSITLSMAQKTIVREASIGVEKKWRTADDGIYEEINWQGKMGQAVTLEKYVCVYTSRDNGDPAASAAARAAEAAAEGVTPLMIDHVDKWEQKWATAEVRPEGDEQSRRWLNFSIYHLIGAGNPGDEMVSISARALTGNIYRGHIFWDAEIFTLPFFIFCYPDAARAALMYRYHTLDAARENARQAGFSGALYPWESAASGKEATPRFVLSSNGEVVPVTSGDLQDHIVADIAYGVWSYWNATDDTVFLLNAGAELLMETARFWVSRSQKIDDEYHILNIEGPDEYHDKGVEDNYFTNAMASWNIRSALHVADHIKRHHGKQWSELSQRIALEPAELNDWAEVAEKMYKDKRSRGNLIEQFAGYFQLEDINVHDYEPRTAPLAIILGYPRTLASQVVKQADVVMALYLLEHELSDDVIRQNFEYYDARTDHGSSLSPAIYGLVAARLGLLDRALAYFSHAATIDLANNMGNAAGGVHIAAMGGLWQQMIMGFAGVRPSREGLYLYPQLPEVWDRLDFSLLWRRSALEFGVDRGRQIQLKISGDRKVPLGIKGHKIQYLQGPGMYISRWDGRTWSELQAG